MFNQYPYQYMQAPRKTEIIHVNGENGAQAFQMMPNSEALLLDDTAPLVWLAQTDGGGYKNLTPFEIKPYKAPAPVDMNEIIKRLDEVERKLNESNFAETKTAE